LQIQHWHDATKTNRYCIKLSNDLAIANVFGYASGKAEAVPLSGAVTIDNTGLVAIVDDAVTTADFRRYDSSR
jgi:hypothetical protein